VLRAVAANRPGRPIPAFARFSLPQQAQVNAIAYLGKRSLCLRSGYAREVLQTAAESDGGLPAAALVALVSEPFVPPGWRPVTAIPGACTLLFGELHEAQQHDTASALMLPDAAAFFRSFRSSNGSFQRGAEGRGLPYALAANATSPAVGAVSSASSPAATCAVLSAADAGVVQHYGGIGTVQEFVVYDANRCYGGIHLRYVCVHSGSHTSSASSPLPTDASGVRESVGTGCPVVLHFFAYSASVVLIRRSGDHNHPLYPRMLSRHPEVFRYVCDLLAQQQHTHNTSFVEAQGTLFARRHHSSMLADAKRVRNGGTATGSRPAPGDTSGRMLAADSTSPLQPRRARSGPVPREVSERLARVPAPAATTVDHR
jgi:hypothetical protein